MVLKEKAGNKMQGSDATKIESKLDTLGIKIRILIKDRDILISCLQDVRDTLNSNHDIKINSLISKIGSALIEVDHA